MNDKVWTICDDSRNRLKTSEFNRRHDGFLMPSSGWRINRQKSVNATRVSAFLLAFLKALTNYVIYLESRENNTGKGVSWEIIDKRLKLGPLKNPARNVEYLKFIYHTRKSLVKGERSIRNVWKTRVVLLRLILFLGQWQDTKRLWAKRGFGKDSAPLRQNIITFP